MAQRNRARQVLKLWVNRLIYYLSNKMNFDYITFFWKTSLRPIPLSALEGLKLSKDTKYFLSAIGLPEQVSQFLHHALEVNFYFDEKIVKRTYNGIDYCIIGDDIGTNFCISCNDDSVYAIDFNNEIPDPFCFVNSSIWQFIYCLQIFSDFQKLAKEGTGDEKELVKSMILKFKEVDFKCLVNESTWWSVIINQPY